MPSLVRDIGGPVYLLRDKQGGASWWCHNCGSRSMGRLLPGLWRISDIKRLAEGHLKRHPQCRSADA